MKSVWKKCTWLCVLAMVGFGPVMTGRAQTFANITYEADDSNIANPERGFYHHEETHSASYTLLSQDDLLAYREEGITLILRLFYLEDFVDTNISDEYLSYMQQDFNTARASGIKMIVRFAYTQRSSAPYGDAPLAQVLTHIEQLAPLLQQHADVIAAVQAGFIGAWGEWYYTDYFAETLGAPTDEDWANRRTLVNALLDALPEGRVIQVRTPDIKFNLTETEEALTEAEAFTNTAQARIGHHNDCFLASSTDVGTYTSNMEAEKAFLEQETKYLPIGGETCGVSMPLSECPNALAQLERFHWSYLNSDYNTDVLDSWEEGDCLPEVYLNLGYRYALTSASLQETAKPGGAISFTIVLENNGWANPYNARLVELVLKNTDTEKTYTLTVDEDPRLWAMDETITLNIAAGLPANMPEGTYALYLNLPDPQKSLQDNPAYAIRLANSNTWNDETGYNSLLHEVTVTNNASLEDYTGSNFFLSTPTLIDYTEVGVDGTADDWENVTTTATGATPTPTLKVFNDADSLYFLISGITDPQSFTLYIDADQTVTQGDLVAPWSSHYADYRITEAGLSVYTGGAWSAVQSVAMYITDEVIEIGVPNTLLTSTPLADQIEVAVTVTTSSATIPIPVSTSPFMSYRMLLNDLLTLKGTSSGSKVILYWASTSAEYYRVLERSLAGAAFTKLAVLLPGDFVYTDDVTEGTEAIYRNYVVTEDGYNVSTYSPHCTLETSEAPAYYVFTADGTVDEWEGVTPLATAVVNDDVEAYRIFLSADYLMVMLEGSVPDAYAFYFNTDNAETTGAADNDWGYAGFDFVLQDGALYDLRTGTRVLVTTITPQTSAGYLEMAIPVSVLDNLGDNTTLYTAASLSFASDTPLFPAADESPLKYEATTPAPTPENVTVENSEYVPLTQLIVKWSACSLCDGYVVERSIATADDFSIVATKNSYTYSHYDSDLTTGTTYYYRVYGYNAAGLSAPSDIVSGTPQTVTAVEDEVATLVNIYPNPAHDYLTIAVQVSGALKLQFVSMQGRMVQEDTIPAGTDVVYEDVSALPAGLYVLKVTGAFQQIMRIVIR